MEVAHPQSGSSFTWFLVELEFGIVGFWQLKMVTQRNFFILDMDKAVDCIMSSCHHCASPCVDPPQWCSSPPTPNPQAETMGNLFCCQSHEMSLQFILILLNAQRTLWHSSQHTDERVHWHPTTGWPPCCNMNWHWPLCHDPWQWLSSSQPKNCSCNQQSQESKQEPSCRTWMWTLSTGSLGWACRPRCTFCCSHNPEFTLMDYKLVGCGCSVISSQFPDSTNWLSSHLSDQCQGSFDGPKSLISTIPWGLCSISVPPRLSPPKRQIKGTEIETIVSLSIICCVFYAPWQADSVFTLLWGCCSCCYLSAILNLFG